MASLLEAVRRYLETQGTEGGVFDTPIAGLTLVRATAPSELAHQIPRPLVALVLQGSKHVAAGVKAYDFSAGDSLLVTADVPTLSRITRASPAAPYYALVLELDPAIIADLTAQMTEENVGDDAPVRMDPTDIEVADAAHGLMRLFDRPASAPVLGPQRVREMHYWLLAGRHGAAIRRLGWPEGHVRRVARAVAVLRADFARPLRIERLAETAGMSPSSFHEHFRNVTSLSPLQFQKQLRLIEAKRLMLSEDASASSAAYAVGYESVSQFTREYGRLFGLSPFRSARAAKAQVQAVA